MEYKSETKACKNCKKDFIIESEDFVFYEKMGSPAPDYCPQCREQRRLSFRNERTLYNRKCSESGKSIVSIYPEDTLFPVYDQHVWWGDSWDLLSY